MPCALVLAFLAAAAPPKKLAAPGLSGLEVAPDALDFYNEHLSLALSRRGLEVVTAKQIGSVIGLERQRELLGCSDASCLAEIASGLGVDAIVIGEVGKFGDALQLHLKVVASDDGRLLASFSKRTKKDDMLEALDEGAAALALGLGIRPPAAAPLPAALPIATGVAGAVALGIGAVLLTETKARWDQLHDPNQSLTDDGATRVAASGSGMQTMGWVAISVGSAALAATAVLTVMRLQSKSVTATAGVGAGSVTVRLELR